MPLTTGELVRLLQEQDPGGERILSILVASAEEPEWPDLVASGEATQWSTCLEDAFDDSDRDVLKLYLRLGPAGHREADLIG
jgi:hypothetical protein